jgi:hypothetical protein
MFHINALKQELRVTNALAKTTHMPVYLKCAKYYGYPDCCTQEFQQNLIENEGKYTDEIRKLNEKKSSKREIRFLAAGNTGFVPCYNHSCQILNNEIEINDLIKNRICEKPFKIVKKDQRIPEKIAVQALMMLNK